VKLVLGEAEATALREALAAWPVHVSSRLLIVESVRACARYGADFATRAQLGLSAVALLPMDDAVLQAAADLSPPSLRSLDAIHLATAVSLGDRLGVMACYDERLAAAARAAGLEVAHPR
jgi:uncharacterized protein